MNYHPEIVNWMKMETQFLAKQNQPERLIELFQLIKPAIINQYNLQVDDKFVDISQTFDNECLGSIYSRLLLDDSVLRVFCYDPLGYANVNNPITIDGIGIENLNGIYPSSAHLYHAIQVHLLGRSDLINVVRDSSSPLKASYIKGTKGKVDTQMFKAWKAIEIDVAFKVNRLKFIQNPPLARELLETGNVEIISPHPPTWGYNRDLDESNMNGKMLMIIREDLRRRI